MTVIDGAIDGIRELIQSGRVGPGDRLPQEAVLCAELGVSRNSMREAIRALVQAKVLTVRQGSGTYVTSLEPSLLLEGLAFAIDLVSDEQLLEVLEVREVIEPRATALAALRADQAQLDEIQAHLERSTQKGSIEELVRHDMAFHSAIIKASGNATLSSILDGLTSRTVRLRIWGGIISQNAESVAAFHHQEIMRALVDRDPIRAEAAALMHVSHARRWLREES